MHPGIIRDKGCAFIGHQQDYENKYERAHQLSNRISKDFNQALALFK